MKKLIFIIIIHVTLFAFSKPIETLSLEEGQSYRLSGSVQKLWIENSKILKAESLGGGIELKALSIGQTELRKNNELIKVVVSPIGSQYTLEKCKSLSKKFIGLKVDLCEHVICLSGKLFRFQDYERILNYLSKTNSSLYLALDTTPVVQQKINLYIENNIRESGLTPLKVNFSRPWRVQFNSKDAAETYTYNYQKLGILASTNLQKIDIADNVRVSVHITEVRKDFGRTLGIKWPDTYAAQIINNQFSAENSFAVALQAKESSGEAKILASPNLICRSGKEAEFFAGGEFPIKILNYKIQDIVWKKYGIMLKIKPQVDATGQMSLQLDTEVSSIDKSRSVDNIPALFTNKVSSHFDLVKSKTIALSGLIKNETGRSSDGLPFLSQIPILGSLFSSKDFMENRTELVIFVTPELMKNESTGDEPRSL